MSIWQEHSIYLTVEREEYITRKRRELCLMKAIEKLKQGMYGNVWIYGAGKVGRKLWNDFNFMQIEIKGFVVTKYDGVKIPETCVVELADINSNPEDTVFIVTVSKKFRSDIILKLQTAGYNNYIIWDENYLCELWCLGEYSFVDRRKEKDKCCFILAGYKEFLWEKTFCRIEQFIDEDIDVCIISSGIYSKRLEKIAEQNEWSYLSTKINSVTLVQNIAFAIYKDYEWVYKIDEDIFVTEGAFELLLQGYLNAERNSDYSVGISVPLIPINGFGYKTILNKCGKASEYESKFGEICVGGNPESEIEKNPETAVFMWDAMPQLDELKEYFREANEYEVCGVRFSIGFMLMHHSFWEQMNGFSVCGNADMGTDEEDVCANCIIQSKAIIVCQRAIVGHFSFGRQTDRMKEYYYNNQEWFDIH